MSRILSRANDDGLPRPISGAVTSSAFSGCVGSNLRARGRCFRGRAFFVALGGFDSTVVFCALDVAFSSVVESTPAEVLGAELGSSGTLSIARSRGSRVARRGLTAARGTSGCTVVDVDEAKSRLLHSFSFVSPDSRDESSISIRCLSRLTARSRRTMPLVIFGL